MSGSWHQDLIFESLAIWQGSCDTCGESVFLETQTPSKQNAEGLYHFEQSLVDLITEPHDISGGTICSDFICRPEDLVQLWGLQNILPFVASQYTSC